MVLRAKKRRRTPAGAESSEYIVEMKDEYAVMPILPSLSQIRRYPLPLKLKRTLRYMETSVGLNPGVAGSAADYVFSANGMYDPNITGIGHQPIGFDQYMSLYEHFTVIGAKISVVFQNTETTYLAWCGIAVRPAATAIVDGQTTMENGMCVVKAFDKAGTTNSFGMLTYPLSIGKYMGRKSILSEDDFRGTSGANPAEQVYFHVFAFPNNAQDIGQITAHVVIDYIAVFTEPKEVAQS